MFYFNRGIGYFTKELESVTCIVGEKVQFECKVVESDQIAQWFKGGTELSNSDKYKVERYGKSHRLVVFNTQLDDQAEYCVKIKQCARYSRLIVQELPAGIRQLSEEDKCLYLKIIKDGTGTRYCIRIVIIGENKTDKACLQRILLGESIKDVESTDGIDKDAIKRKDFLTRKKIAVSLIANESANIKHKRSDNKENQKSTAKEDEETKVKRKFKEVKIQNTESSTPSTDDDDEMPPVDCIFVDVPSERQYYPIHSFLLNPNAIYMLVADILSDIKPKNTDDGYDNIGDNIEFWFNRIHYCAPVETTKDSNGDFLNPPVILVCTGIDKCTKELKDRKDEFSEKIVSLLVKDDKRNHLRHICYISSTVPSPEDRHNIRQSIFGKDLETFAERLPLRWIRLEKELENKREDGVNILSWSDIRHLASTCSIKDNNEIILFLKYHHNIGNIIYFENIEDHIILNHQWLADAFECLLSAEYDDDLKLTMEWRTLEETGGLTESLIVKLFQKEPEFNEHKDYLLKVMNRYNIISKLRTVMEDEHIYYMPDYMISRQISIDQIYDRFQVIGDTCTRTPWLLIEFDFMPFDFFDHILCHYIRQYSVCTEAKSERRALYHGIGVFVLEGNSKFILCFSKNTIAMQIWQWTKLKQGKCQFMLEELRSVIHKVKDTCEARRVSFTVKTKCSNGNIHIAAGRKSYKELTDLESKDYSCEDHLKTHDVSDFFHTWFENYSEKNEDNIPAMQTFKEIPDTRFLQKCTVCDKEPTVYWCHACKRSMCKDCNNHNQGPDYSLHCIVQHVYDKFSCDYNFQPTVEEIRDIKVLQDGLLVMVDKKGKKIVTCQKNGQQQQTIPLSGEPLCLAVIDNNTVAVTSRSKVDIVDVRERKVKQTFPVKGWCYGVMYRDNKMFVGFYDKTIQIMSMSGTIERAIQVKVTPSYICGCMTGRIYYTDCHQLHCIDMEGNPMLTFTDPKNIRPTGIATTDEGNLLVAYNSSSSVLQISPDGSQVILRKIPSSSRKHSWRYSCLSYDSVSKSVVVGIQNNVYVYKKI